MIYFDPEVPRSRQVADHLRDRIASGEFDPDERLPRQEDLAKAYGVTRPTVARAFGILRRAGLIAFEQRPGLPALYYARSPEPLPDVILNAGDTVGARMPSGGERSTMRLPAGVPLLIVTRAAGKTEHYSGDTRIVAAPDPERGAQDVVDGSPVHGPVESSSSMSMST